MGTYDYISEFKAISTDKNLINIRGVMPYSKVGVVNAKTGEVLVYGEADDHGRFEEEIAVEEDTVVYVRVRYPQDPPLEKKVTLERGMAMPIYQPPDEDWMWVLYE